jgi:hypothetical protein
MQRDSNVDPIFTPKDVHNLESKRKWRSKLAVSWNQGK